MKVCVVVCVTCIKRQWGGVFVNITTEFLDLLQSY